MGNIWGSRQRQTPRILNGCPNCQQLNAEVAHLKEENAVLRREIASMKQEMARLKIMYDALERNYKRLLVDNVNVRIENKKLMDQAANDASDTDSKFRFFKLSYTMM